MFDCLGLAMINEPILKVGVAWYCVNEDDKINTPNHQPI